MNSKWDKYIDYEYKLDGWRDGYYNDVYKSNPYISDEDIYKELDAQRVYEEYKKHKLGARPKIKVKREPEPPKKRDIVHEEHNVSDILAQRINGYT